MPHARPTTGCSVSAPNRTQPRCRLVFAFVNLFFVRAATMFCLLYVLPRAGEGNRDSTVSGVESGGNYGAATLSMKVFYLLSPTALLGWGLNNRTTSLQDKWNNGIIVKLDRHHNC
jgi:hypothetical protein